jgi:hypothetical protein
VACASSVACGASAVGVAATPQAVATVPANVIADTFRKSRRFNFLLSIAISFFRCIVVKKTKSGDLTDTFFLLLLYHPR